jgi:hypothetical protein
MDWPVEGNGKRENYANGTRFNDGTESFIVIDAVFLRETTNYPSSLVTRKSAVGVIFVLENLFSTNDISP